MTMQRFDGLTVLLTGATGGFGLATARRFASEGARFVLSDIDQGKLDAMAADLDADAVCIAGDVADPALHRALVAAAEDRFGGVDIAVNNAGIVHPFSNMPDISEADARRTIEVDLMGVLWAMQAQLPSMAARFSATGARAAIVNIASLAGIGGAPMLSVYAAAKHGVVGLTRSAALEYVRMGIRVNAVCPGLARTPMVEQGMLGGVHGMDPAEAEKRLLRGVPMGRMGTPEEIAQAIAFAAAPENSFMTGQTVSVDGGITAT
jgi:NAD(P)-dependent dehydrogenase (short-subunit alcohol dehydrogenase family)